MMNEAISIPKVLLIAGGGTGGHVFPGIAVAEEWQKNGGRVVFVGTPEGQENIHVPKAGFLLERIIVGKIKGNALSVRLKTLLGLPYALWCSIKLINKYKPDVILGIGGYASGPMGLASFLKRVPLSVMDQNAIPGMTNRILGRVAKKIYLTFETAQRFFDAKKCVMTGNPLRSQMEFMTYPESMTPLHIFAFGGSQGAMNLNTHMMNAFKILSKSYAVQLVHQTGEQDFKRVSEFYEQNGLNVTVKPFFDNMPELYKKAHLLICRSGAGSVAESALVGRPAIYIPLPTSADDHQTHNALEFVQKKAGLLFKQNEQSSEELARIVQNLIENPQELLDMAQEAHRLAKPYAKRDIVAELLKLTH